MAVKAPPVAAASTPTRKPSGRRCACGGVPGPSGLCAECERKAQVQRHAAGPSVGIAPGLVHQAIAGPGRPLDSGTRAVLEPGFGRSLAEVRVHTDDRAAESARAVNAHAYTVGRDIVFAHGRYEPDSVSGRRLIAHEVAHTVQQASFQRSPSGPLTIAPESSALETEANRAAHAVLSGGTAPPLTTALPSVSREPDLDAAAKKECASVASAPSQYDKAKLKAAGVVEICPPPKDPKGEPIFVIDVFKLPAEKGPLANEPYRKAAAVGQLQAVIDPKQGSSEFGQARDRTNTLRASWLQKVGWSTKSAKKNWEGLGGKTPADEFKPAAQNHTCHLDHIIELQLGGTNARENVQVLDGDPNTKSGGDINRWLVEKAKAIQDAHKQKPIPQTIQMRFNKVDGGSSQTVEDLAQTKSKKQSCIEIECKVLKGGTAGGDTGEEPVGFEKTNLLVGATKHLAYLDPGDETRFDEGSPVQRNTRQIVVGFLLNTYTRGKKTDSIEAEIDAGELVGRRASKGPSNAPIAIAITKQPNPEFSAQDAPDQDKRPTKKIRFAKMTDPKLKFHYPWLSEGEIDLDSSAENHEPDVDAGHTGRGVLHTSFPLLRGVDLALLLEKDKLGVRLEAGRKSFPGMPFGQVTEASLEGTLLPELRLGGALGFAFGPYAKARFDLGVGEGGFVANGQVDVDVPHVGKANGFVQYRNQLLTGQFAIRPQDLRIPHLKDAALYIEIDSQGLHPRGEVVLDIGGNPVVLGVHAENNEWVFTGRGRFKFEHFQNLESIDVAFRYARGKITGEANAAIVWKSFKGTLRVLYDDDRLTIGGRIDIEHGRIKGYVSIFGASKGRWTADGEVDFRVTDRIRGTVRLQIDENENARFASAIRFDPISLTSSGYAGKRHLAGPFKYDYHITAGLKLRASTGLALFWDVRPAQIVDLEFKAAFDPFKDDPNLELEGGARLVAGGIAGLEMSLAGAFIWENSFFVSAKGELAGVGQLGLDMLLQAPAKVRYQMGEFTIDAGFQVVGRPSLIFKLGGELSINVFLRRAFYRKYDWEPRTVAWQPGEVKVDGRFHYSTAEKFSPPFLSPTYPPFDASWMQHAFDAVDRRLEISKAVQAYLRLLRKEYTIDDPN